MSKYKVIHTPASLGLPPSGRLPGQIIVEVLTALTVQALGVMCALTLTKHLQIHIQNSLIKVTHDYMNRINVNPLLHVFFPLYSFL